MQALRRQRTTNIIKLGKVIYKPYTVGNLPPTFAFTYNEEDDADGITSWFNYKGLTYIKK
jgi:hypothetical protein